MKSWWKSFKNFLSGNDEPIEVPEDEPLDLKFTGSTAEMLAEKYKDAEFMAKIEIKLLKDGICTFEIHGNSGLVLGIMAKATGKLIVEHDAEDTKMILDTFVGQLNETIEACKEDKRRRQGENIIPFQHR